MRARVRVAQGRLAEAMDWVRERGLSADDELDFLREFEHVTLARVLVARHERGGDERAAHDALRLLERLQAAAEQGGRTATVIETLVLEALARRALGDVRGALRPLERALALAEPEGYLRVFLDEGVRMRDLLRQATARGIAGEHTPRVLSAFDAPARPAPAAAPAAMPAAGAAAGPAAGPAQPLTTREMEVLRLIAAGLRNQEIAEQLSISTATVKRHIANTFGKHTEKDEKVALTLFAMACKFEAGPGASTRSI